MGMLNYKEKKMLNYSFNNSDFSIVLTDKVLAHFEKYKQIRFRDKEAGGQLFARFDGIETLVEEATGPRPTDKRTRNSYRPDRFAEQEEIFRMYERNLHYVGDWHTHPSLIPEASGIDVSNIRSCVINSLHKLNGFLMIIVGTNSFPTGLRVSIHTGQQELVLSAMNHEVNTLTKPA